MSDSEAWKQTIILSSVHGVFELKTTPLIFKLAFYISIFFSNKKLSLSANCCIISGLLALYASSDEAFVVPSTVTSSGDHMTNVNVTFLALL